VRARKKTRHNFLYNHRVFFLSRTPSFLQQLSTTLKILFFNSSHIQSNKPPLHYSQSQEYTNSTFTSNATMKFQLLTLFAALFTLLGLITAAPTVVVSKDIESSSRACNKVWWLCFKQPTTLTTTADTIPIPTGLATSVEPISSIVFAKDVDTSTTSEPQLSPIDATLSKNLESANGDCAKVWWLCFKTGDHICNIAPWLCAADTPQTSGPDSTSVSNSISKDPESARACNKVWWLCFKEALSTTLAQLPGDKIVPKSISDIVVAKDLDSSNRDCAKVWWLCFKQAPTTTVTTAPTGIAGSAQPASDVVFIESQPATDVTVASEVDSAHGDCAKVWWLCFKEAPVTTLIPIPTGVPSILNSASNGLHA